MSNIAAEEHVTTICLESVLQFTFSAESFLLLTEDFSSYKMCDLLIKISKTRVFLF